eukprot:COSAG05_NODE_21214_length_273_cov_1.264368_1_plen_77_part_10
MVRQEKEALPQHTPCDVLVQVPNSVHLSLPPPQQPRAIHSVRWLHAKVRVVGKCMDNFSRLSRRKRHTARPLLLVMH